MLLLPAGRPGSVECSVNRISRQQNRSAEIDRLILAVKSSRGTSGSGSMGSTMENYDPRCTSSSRLKNGNAGGL
jgi:hypothetical protein